MEKIGYMLENPQVSWWYSSTVGNLKTVGSENPQVTRTISREVLSMPASHPDSMTPQRLHADSLITRGAFQAYFQGALHDGTRNDQHNSFRIVQKGQSWLLRLKHILKLLGFASWIYREGKTRDDIYVLETTAGFLDVDFDPGLLSRIEERIAYVRGYFDAEGGMPRSLDAKPFQIQFVQKDRIELEKVKGILVQLGIRCGKTHNPSVRLAPDYWRFYVSAASMRGFARTIGTWHPRKESLLGKMI